MLLFFVIIIRHGHAAVLGFGAPPPEHLRYRRFIGAALAAAGAADATRGRVRYQRGAQ